MLKYTVVSIGVCCVAIGRDVVSMVDRIVVPTKVLILMNVYTLASRKGVFVSLT